MKSARPKIGLALSGGAARGFAHVGVLKVLEEFNFPIDYICGTSVGSIIAGAYAAGLSVNQLEEVARSARWRDVRTTDRRPTASVCSHRLAVSRAGARLAVPGATSTATAPASSIARLRRRRGAGVVTRSLELAPGLG